MDRHIVEADAECRADTRRGRATLSPAPQHAELIGRAFHLEWPIIASMVVESTVAIGAGMAGRKAQACENVR